MNTEMKAFWAICIEHEAFGTECQEIVRASRLAAWREACRRARQGGHGWHPHMRPALEAEVQP